MALQKDQNGKKTITLLSLHKIYLRFTHVCSHTHSHSHSHTCISKCYGTTEKVCQKIKVLGGRFTCTNRHACMRTSRHVTTSAVSSTCRREPAGNDTSQAAAGPDPGADPADLRRSVRAAGSVQPACEDPLLRLLKAGCAVGIGSGSQRWLGTFAGI